MRRAFAGLLGVSLPEASERLRSALAPEGDATTWASGDLAVGSTGPRPPEGAGMPICLLDGVCLPAGGHGGPDASSPELALGAAYATGGPASLGALRGDWALFLWDPEHRTGCIARDPLGGRPLFVHGGPHRLAFASEVRILLRLLPVHPGVDGAAAAFWLARGRQPGERTLFDGVRRLEPGCAQTLGRPVSTRRFWQPLYSEPSPVSHDEAAALLRSGVEEAVARRLPEAGGAVMLSGGLDSSMVAAVAGGLSRARGAAAPRAYSAVFPDHPHVDESPLARTVATDLGLAWTRGGVRGGSALAGALDYQRQWSMPAPSPNRFFDQILLQRAARDGVGVMLDGEGGDEAFGASPFLVADHLGAGGVGQAIALAQDLAGEHASRGEVVARILLRYGVRALLPAGMHAMLRAQRDPFRHAPPWLRPRAASRVLEEDETWHFKRLPGPRWWGWLVHQLTTARESAGVATHLGREASAAGLESRHPYLDLDLVELVLATPPGLSFHRRVDRPLQRAAATGLVPEVVRVRSEKARFNAIQNDAIALADGPWVRRLLGDPGARVNAYADPQALQEGPLADMEGHRRGQAGSWTMALWRLLTLECWLRELEDSGFAERLTHEASLEAARVDLGR